MATDSQMKDQVTVKQTIKRFEASDSRAGGYTIKLVVEGGVFEYPGMDLAALAVAYEAIEKSLADNSIEPSSLNIEVESLGA